MKKKVLILLPLLFLVTIASHQVYSAQTLPIPKKNIEIFTCVGGGGHVSTSNALQSYLGDDYNISVVNAFSQVLSPMDPVSFFSFDRYKGVDIYNYFLRNQWTWLTNELCSYGKKIIRWQSKKIERTFTKYLENRDVDMIISVIPLVNKELLSIAQKKNIPFLVVTNDLDTQNYINGLKTPSFDKFSYTLSFDDVMLKKKIVKAKIPNHSIAVTGFPLRKDFYESKKPDLIRKKFDLPSDKPVILLMMGACGTSKLKQYLKKIFKTGIEAHVIACVGRNESLKRKIERMKHPANITVTALGFTKEISDLMAVSDVLITKAGPNSVCESIQMGLPMLLDSTSGQLKWEKLNTKFVIKHNLGMKVSRFRDFPHQLKKMLRDKNYYTAVKKNIAQFKNNPFPTEIRKLVGKMLSAQNAQRTKAAKTS